MAAPWPADEPLSIVSLVALDAGSAERIRAVDSRVRLVEAGGWFSGEYRDTWAEATAGRYVDGAGHGTRAERDALLASADVAIAGFPFPKDLLARAPRLHWMHQTPAGASNLRQGDIWGGVARVTTSRGHGETRAIAEYVMAAFGHFARGFDRAIADRLAGRFEHRGYGIRGMEGKTLLVIGAGGIGREVAVLGDGHGMRVVGTRRNVAARAGDEAFEVIRAAEELPSLLAEADFVAVCCQWTEETTHLLDANAFRAMKDGVIVTNIARGEIVDEGALLDALDAGKVRGAALDVYVGEFEHPPPERLWKHPGVLVTPHVSAQTDVSRRRSTDIFCDNLRRFLEGEPLRYEVDWEAGY